MALPDSLHNAVKTLTGALDLLEAAVERRVRADAARAQLEQELALMQEDRARLGEALEQSQLAGEQWRHTGAAVAERLEQMDAVCATLRDRLGD
ncbi:DUF4164 family protein [Lichenihabitans sp. Uapishka_5]|uniref:DUF4164 family protein n=1 Tax=Lichenihabitans sp. Uapishka_5 TaxID=3037302 RepID=UPI0029E7EE9D|nr:DUF4164 family protein [Lichenihabitans sp. Uapishka_5]MDX7949924.1 DUF4164 family protein [Lichenihabitans sp. Uapishka_5]